MTLNEPRVVRGIEKGTTVPSAKCDGEIVCLRSPSIQAQNAFFLFVPFVTKCKNDFAVVFFNLLNI